MSKQTEILKVALEALKRVKDDFQWTWDNMGKPHTSDHFNRPANGIKEIEDTIANLESALSDDGWVSVEKENIEMKKLLNEMLQMKVCWKKNSTKNMWNRALAFIKDFKQTSKI